MMMPEPRLENLKNSTLTCLFFFPGYLLVSSQFYTLFNQFYKIQIFLSKDTIFGPPQEVSYAVPLFSVAPFSGTPPPMSIIVYWSALQLI